MGCVIYNPNWPNNISGTGNPPGPVYDDPDNFYADYFFLRTDAGSLSKIGYQLLGWDWSPTATSPAYPLNSRHYGEFLGPGDHMLYAVWTPNPSVYTVTYNGNGNTGGVAPVDSNSPYAHNATVVVLGQGFLTKTNNVFLGWSTNPNAVDAQYAPNSTFLIGSNVVLYAVWAPPRTLVYDGNGTPSGSPPVDSNSPYMHGSTVTLLGQGSLWFNGWYFAGWSTDPNAVWPENVYGPGSQFIITADMVLYAIWVYGGPPVGNQYQVFYNKNGTDVSGSVPVDYNVYVKGSTVTVLGNTGNLSKPNKAFLGWSTNSNATSAQYTAGSTFGMPPNSITLYAVWGSGGGGSGSGGGGTRIIVPYNGRCGDDNNNGSKQRTITYNGSPIIMQVESNLPSKLESNAVIENLVIDGKHVSGTVGILLENVCNCVVRNLTIRDCDVGIEVKLSGISKAFGNRFEHIRMINVKKGILFTGTSTSQDFSCTSIDDVGISLAIDKNNPPPSYEGIKIGPNAKLHNAFIKATVWTSHDETQNTHRGLLVEGELRYSLVNLEVEDSGVGVQIKSGAVVSDNQSFLLTTFFDPNLNGIKVDKPYNGYVNDIVEAT